MLKRTARVLVVMFVIARSSGADQKWMRVDTPNFIVIGTVGESRLRSIGTQFEGFREALTKLLSSSVTATAVPTVVVVFSDDKSFQPFKPVYNGKPVDIAGLFVPRSNINYILIGPQRSTDSLRPVFHEYSHLIVNNVAPDLPVWLNEGLAEYYSSFNLENNGQSVTLGNPIDGHYRILGTESWLPLKELLATKHDSPEYNENSRRSIFYAESWMLVHMLLHGQPSRGTQFSAYLGALSKGVDPAAAWDQQFGREDMLKALRFYSSQPLLGAKRYTLSDHIVRASGTPVALAPADTECTLGELLVALGRSDEGLKHLDRAIELTPASARALVGKALATGHPPGAPIADSGSTDWLSDYMIGTTLLDNSFSAGSWAVEAARSALDRAVRARGDIPNLQVVYARALDETGTEPVKMIEALKQAHDAVPARDDYALLLARGLVRSGQYADARSILGAVMAHPHLPGSKEAALSAMRWTVAVEENASRRAAAASESPNGVRANPDSTASGGVDTSVVPDYRRVQPGEQRVEGTLERIECTPKRIEFVVRLPDRVARFQASAMDHVEFISYRPDLTGSVSCGPRPAPDHVYVTARAGDLDGTVIAVEFLPKR